MDFFVDEGKTNGCDLSRESAVFCHTIWAILLGEGHSQDLSGTAGTF